MKHLLCSRLIFPRGVEINMTMFDAPSQLIFVSQTKDLSHSPHWPLDIDASLTDQSVSSPLRNGENLDSSSTHRMTITLLAYLRSIDTHERVFVFDSFTESTLDEPNGAF